MTEQPWDPDAEIAAIGSVTPEQVAEAARELSRSLIAVVRPEPA
ncbi:hypothetical protein ACFQ6N_04590 [Kitasatospora sp. NPDC056446]